jgi:hypothetical protein
MPPVTQKQIDALELGMSRSEAEDVLGGHGSLEPPAGVGASYMPDADETRYWGNKDAWVAVDFKGDKVLSFSNPQLPPQ